MSLRAVIVQHGANLDGSAISGLLLADGLRERGFETHVVFGFHGPIIDRYRDHGHQTVVVEHKSWLRTSQFLRFVRTATREVTRSRAVAEVIDSLRPDVVYVNSAVSLAGALAASRAGVPCIWHLRELFEDVGGEMRVPPSLKNSVRRLIRRLSDRLVVNSQAVAANMLGADGGDEATVVPNAADNAFFELAVDRDEARQKFGLPVSDRPILGVPGTLRPMKGHSFLFEALPRLIERFPGLIVTITGSTVKRHGQELIANIERMKLDAHVRFLGTVDQMPAFYRACDVVCIPSSSEPFGRTVIEAFATGTPVVATAVGGIPEIVTHGETGLLVEYGDAASLADSIGQVLTDENLGRRLSTAALREARVKYTEEVYKGRLADLVLEVSNRNQPRVGYQTEDANWQQA